MSWCITKQISYCNFISKLFDFLSHSKHFTLGKEQVGKVYSEQGEKIKREKKKGKEAFSKIVETWWICLSAECWLILVCGRWNATPFLGRSVSLLYFKFFSHNTFYVSFDYLFSFSVCSSFLGSNFRCVSLLQACQTLSPLESSSKSNMCLQWVIQCWYGFYFHLFF